MSELGNILRLRSVGGFLDCMDITPPGKWWRTFQTERRPIEADMGARIRLRTQQPPWRRRLALRLCLLAAWIVRADAEVKIADAEGSPDNM